MKLVEKLEAFECQRCLECCKQPGFVYLREEEVDWIAEYLNISPHEFTDKYCDVVDRRLVLKKHSNEHCVFLDDKGCTIHEAKPIQCKEFPTHWITKNCFDYCEGIKKLGLTLKDYEAENA